MPVTAKWPPRLSEMLDSTFQPRLIDPRSQIFNWYEPVSATRLALGNLCGRFTSLTPVVLGLMP